MMKDNRITNIRVFAIILVVLAHSIIIFNPSWNYYIPKYSSTFFKYLCAAIYIFHMPLFFSLSGYLYGISKDKHNWNLKSLVYDKSKRLLIPYLFFSLFWLLPIRLLIKYKNYAGGQSLLKLIFDNIILGKDNGHLWFLIALFLIFLLYFILEKITIISKNNYLFFAFLCILSVIGGHILPSFIGSAFSNLMWFGLGDFIRKEKNYIFKYKKVLLVLSVLVILASILYLKLYLNENFKFLCFILKSGICVILIPIIYSLFPNNLNSKMVFIDKNSFGIYLFHSPLVYITYTYWNNINPIFIFIINFIGFGIIALLLTLSIRKIGLGFLMGEKAIKSQNKRTNSPN